LRTLGFSLVAETAAGAEFITERSFEENGGSAKGTICSTCPAVTSYVEKHRPELTGELIPVVSPMVAHARLLKKETEGLKVVFIGPRPPTKRRPPGPKTGGRAASSLSRSFWSG
jgi:iron only hydrogenase large subunit-like protein